jgi:hypothetical protein
LSHGLTPTYVHTSFSHEFILWKNLNKPGIAMLPVIPELQRLSRSITSSKAVWAKQ